MKKIVYSPLQIFMLSLLFFFSILFMISDNPFTWEEQGGSVCFSYIQEGDYTLDVFCVPTDQQNQVMVYSDKTTGEDGEVGAVLVQIDLDPEQQFVSIPLSLKDGVYSVSVGTTLDTEEESFVNSANLKSNGILYRDGTFLGGLCIAVALVFAFVFARFPKEKYLMPCLAIAFGLIAGIPQYAEFTLGGHDFPFHLQRIEGIYQAMRAGDFPVRLNPLDLSGYGYLSATMYPQYFLYPVALLRFLNVAVLTCYKILVIMTNLATALIAYYSVKNITKSDKIGIVMSFLYTFSAYRLVCVYVRAALGETLAMAFLPLVIWGAYECLWGQKRWIILVLGMTGVLGSHVLSAEMCAGFLLLELLWWFCSKKKNDVRKRILAGLKAIFVTVFLNLSFLIPFLYFSTQDLICFDMESTVANSVLYFSQMFSLFLSKDGSSVPRGTTVHDMSFTVGTVLLIGMLIFLLWAGFKRKKDESVWRTGIHCAVYAMIAIASSSWLMPWGAIVERGALIGKLAASIQYAWRFLGPASLFMALCTAVGLVKLTEYKKELNWLVGVVVTLCLVTAWTLFDDLKEHDAQYLNPMDRLTAIYVDDLYLYRGTSSELYIREEAVPSTVNGTEVIVSNYKKRTTHITLDITPLGEGADYLKLPLYYYPGYEIWINGEKVKVYQVDTLVVCEMPLESAHIEVKYVGMSWFRVGDVISLLTMLGIIGIAIRHRSCK